MMDSLTIEIIEIGHELAAVKATKSHIRKLRRWLKQRYP